MSRLLIFAVCMIVGTSFLQAYDFDDGTFRYRILDETERTCVVKGFKKYNKLNIEIPQTVETADGIYTVTEIGSGAFEGIIGIAEISPGIFDECGLISVKLPLSIKKIGKRAFARCEDLSVINFPESLVEIGDSAFWCEWVPGPSHGDGNYYVAEHASYGAEHVLSKEKSPIYRLPDSISHIGKAAFYKKYNFHIANIPAKLKEIEDYAFYECVPIDMTLPDGLIGIGSYSFFSRNYVGSNQLPVKELKIPDTVESIGKYAFCGLRMDKVILSAGLTNIEDYTFTNTLLKEIVIPEGVETIGSYAFQGCELIELKLPSTLKSISDGAFTESLYGKNPFKEVFIPNRVMELGRYAFYNCKQLSHVTLPLGLKIIPEGLFSGCDSLISISFGQSGLQHADYVLRVSDEVHTIEGDAFSGCRLLKEVNLPASIRKIGVGNPFSNCDNLQNINVDRFNVRYTDDNGVLMTLKKDSLLSFPGGRSGVVSVNQSVRTICENAFLGSKNINNVLLPEGLECISDKAFYDCISLCDVTFPSTLTEIGFNAFYNAPINEVVIPHNVEIVGYQAFDSSLKAKFNVVRIYGEFDSVNVPFGHSPQVAEAVYYITLTPQESNWNNIKWGLVTSPAAEIWNTPLYVLAESYDEIKNNSYEPWCGFKDIRIYNPADDPYYEAYMSSVNGIAVDSDSDCDVKYFTLSGIRVGSDRLQPGIYIKRRGMKTEKVFIRDISSL